jgi:hypothetical protein
MSRGGALLIVSGQHAIILIRSDAGSLCSIKRTSLMPDFSMLYQKDFTRFLELKRRTLELLALVSSGLTPAQKAEVEDDILNGELRLAVEFMVDFIADNDSSISPKTFRLIEDLLAELKSNRILCVS